MSQPVRVHVGPGLHFRWLKVKFPIPDPQSSGKFPGNQSSIHITCLGNETSEAFETLFVSFPCINSHQKKMVLADRVTRCTVRSLVVSAGWTRLGHAALARASALDNRPSVRVIFLCEINHCMRMNAGRHSSDSEVYDSRAHMFARLY